MTFQHQVTARFFEVDRAGIIFFGRVYEYCHTVFEELLDQMFGGIEAMFETLGFGMPLVHSEADYFKPIKIGDRLTIHVSIEKLGESSVTFHYSICSAAGKQHCVVKMVHAFVDFKTFKSITVPRRFVEGLEALNLLAQPKMP